MPTPSLQSGHVIKLAGEILARYRSPSDAAPELTQFFCRWFDCLWGTYWHVDRQRRTLTALFSWNSESNPAEKLRKDTEALSFSANQGLAAHVWISGTPVCTCNLAKDMCWPRALHAIDSGLNSGIWFPIKHEGETFAVIELLGHPCWSSDEKFLHELTILGFELGKLFCGIRNRISKESDPP